MDFTLRNTPLLQLTEACQSEMSRAVRLALWDYKPGAAFTAACDADVDSQCPRVGACMGVCSFVTAWGRVYPEMPP